MRRTHRAALLAFFVAATFAGSAFAGEPSAEDRAAARAAAERGAKLFDEKKYAEALDLFTRAETLLHAPTHLLMRARSEAALGRLVEARETYIQITREMLDAKAPPAFKRAQEAATTELEALTPRIAEITLVLSGPGAKDAEAMLDGAAVPAALIGMPRPLDPGKHVFAATTEGARGELEVTIAEGEKKTIELTLVADASAGPVGPDVPGPGGDTPGGDDGDDGGSGVRYGGYALMAFGGAAAVAGVALTVVSLTTRGEADDKFDTCGVGCSGPPADEVRDLDDKATTLGNASIGLYVGAAALLGAGVGMSLAGGGDVEPASDAGAVQWTPWLGFGQAGLSGRF